MSIIMFFIQLNLQLSNKKNSIHLVYTAFHIYENKFQSHQRYPNNHDYLFDHVGAFLAFFNPGFFLSLILGSLFNRP